MSNITANMVKELREKTGVGMMDCKKALAETNGNFEEAVDYLRKKGIASAAKKADRVSMEGLIGVAVNGNHGLAVELNSETDFVAKNQKFQDLLGRVLAFASSNSLDAESLKEAKYSDSLSFNDMVAEFSSAIGENIVFRRLARISVDNGVVVSYTHNQFAPNQGKIGVLVALESKAPKAALEALGKKLAMHIAAASPEALTIADMSAERVEREKAILTEQALASGNPPQAIERMIEGRIRKFYEETVLMEQAFALDNKVKISQLLKDFAASEGAEVAIKQYIRFSLGGSKEA